MKKILVLLVFIFSSCQIEYDGETKIVVKGKIVDGNNNPIINKEVNLYVTRDQISIPFVFYFPSETNNIGKTNTNNNGEYTMVIPKPENNFTEIIVVTNATSTDYNKKQFRNIQLNNFNNFELNLPISKLYNESELTTLNITLNQVTQNVELRDITLLGTVINEIEYINMPENFSFYNQLESIVKKNQTIILRYTLFNYSTNTTSIIEENVVINDANLVSFTLNY